MIGVGGTEGYSVACNGDETEWFIVQRVKKNGILQRVELPERYADESDASAARAELIASEG